MLALLVALFVYGLMSCNARAADAEAFAAYSHTSDLFRGRPFNDRDEWSADFIGGGVTISAGKARAWEIDLAHGFKRNSMRRGYGWENGTTLNIRFYPGRLQ
jgi:hypothetical protein